MSSPPLMQDLPAALQSLEAAPLFVIQLAVKPPVVVGQTAGPDRRIGVVGSGAFKGERIAGAVLEGSSDLLAIRSDGSTTLDARLILQTDDGVPILMTYRGIRHMSDEVKARMEQGGDVDPASYYFRIAPSFEAPRSKYEWLNRVIAVGVGHRLGSGPVYSVFEIL
ncbi:DUF3237 domain-containing protein [Paraburkholderia acidisoli]|uniref:UPF0311 protein FAZ98_26300 n=1 Tax=Paraburkholderia acidisoli TaxID=2571748 RepID=A0A7Z2JJE3_9BURK|nr:DUF3237 domain-containing protein [Paraburkholderia acidisoli]QGZ65285.1 DUF3237 family protein [Paraburkholderia acidisoli]